MAYSSARRLGSMKLGGTPHTQISHFHLRNEGGGDKIGVAIML